MEVLGRDQLRHPATSVAPGLLGARLVVGDPANQVVVRLTEVEAYEGTRDPGSHAFRGRTPRNAVMFGPPGHLYVYFSYGMHWCANVVCGPEGVASAVLLRAGEVVAGQDLARERRGPRPRAADLARGPARLARCLGLDRSWNGRDLCGAGTDLRIDNEGTVPSSAVRCGPRVGVSGPGGDGGEYPWRFWIGGDPTVSDYRPGRPRRPAAEVSGQVGHR